MIYVVHKPFGVLSQLTSNDPKERKKIFLGALHDFPMGFMPVGRLDEKSEGLLLLTKDGKLSDRINRSGIEKEYFAQLDGVITDQAIEELRQGVDIGLSGRTFRTSPCRVHRIDAPSWLSAPHPMLRVGRHRPASWLSLTLIEGKYRQVRKMTAAVGFPTLRLIRVRIGDLKLETMKPGDVLTLEKFTF